MSEKENLPRLGVMGNNDAIGKTVIIAHVGFHHTTMSTTVSRAIMESSKGIRESDKDIIIVGEKDMELDDDGHSLLDAHEMLHRKQKRENEDVDRLIKMFTEPKQECLDSAYLENYPSGQESRRNRRAKNKVKYRKK